MARYVVDATSFTFYPHFSTLEAMGIELSLFCCHTGDLELGSPEVRSAELGSSTGSEFTGRESGLGSAERRSTDLESSDPESSEFVSTEYESTELETVVSGRVEDVPLRRWWPMDDDRLLATLYGSRCVLTDEPVPRDSFVVMRTHPVLVSLVNASVLGRDTDRDLDSCLHSQRVDPFGYPRF